MRHVTFLSQVEVNEKQINNERKRKWKKKKLTFQSSDVTSLLLGTSVPPFWMQCLRTSWFPLFMAELSFIFQILAVESPDLLHE